MGLGSTDASLPLANGVLKLELNLEQAVQVGLMLAMPSQGQETAAYRKGQSKISLETEINYCILIINI